MSNPPDEMIRLAIDAASRSSCKKSQRGAVIHWPERAISVASNGPPYPFVCGGSEECGQDCNRIAVHAEERAIIQARCDVTGTDLLHVKVVGNSCRLVASGPPSCWQCSRMIVEAGLRGVWLYHLDGWEFYLARDFHMATLEYCNLPRSLHIELSST